MRNYENNSSSDRPESEYGAKECFDDCKEHRGIYEQEPDDSCHSVCGCDNAGEHCESDSE